MPRRNINAAPQAIRPQLSAAMRDSDRDRRRVRRSKAQTHKTARTSTATRS